MAARQYNFQDILNGLNDTGSDSLAPETGASSDPSLTVLLNTFAQAAEAQTTVDTATVVAANQVVTWDSGVWSAFLWS